MLENYLKNYFKTIGDSSVELIADNNTLKDGFFESLENDYYLIYKETKLNLMLGGESFNTLTFLDKKRRAEIYFFEKKSYFEGKSEIAVQVGGSNFSRSFMLFPKHELKSNNEREIEEGIKFFEKIRKTTLFLDFSCCDENDYYLKNYVEKIIKSLEVDNIRRKIDRVVIKNNNTKNNKL